jgi:hypothetical protein
MRQTIRVVLEGLAATLCDDASAWGRGRIPTDWSVRNGAADAVDADPTKPFRSTDAIVDRP